MVKRVYSSFITHTRRFLPMSPPVLAKPASLSQEWACRCSAKFAPALNRN